MTFHSPIAFIALLILPLLVLWTMRQGQRGGLGFSSVSLVDGCGRSWRQRLIQLPLILRFLALILLVVGLARPQQGLEKVFDLNRGIAIEMVVDRSGSMGAEMEYEGREMTRLDVVKKVFTAFVTGNDQGLEGRPSDLIGLVSFAAYADTVAPLTLAHGAVQGFVDSVQLVERDSPENMTAIGDAIALAAARLKSAEESLSRQGGKSRESYEIKSKIIILLTDGENNAGSRTPEEAAALAKEWGIKIYTIGVGGERLRKVQTLFGARMMRTGSGVDQKTLEGLADSTGGLFRMAEDGEALEAVYQEIDALEKSEVESVRYLDYKEQFTPFALAAFLLLGVEILLSCTVLRRCP